MKRWNKLATPLLAGCKVGDGLLSVWCPYCRRYHTHGWATNAINDNDAEHRAAHCDDGSPLRNGGYYITVLPKQ